MAYYYRICQICGSNLDPDEQCDCEKERGKEQKDENTESPDEESASAE